MPEIQGGMSMNENEKEFIRIIQEAKNPAKAMAMVADMIRRLNAGEDVESIARSYGIKLAT